MRLLLLLLFSFSTTAQENLYSTFETSYMRVQLPEGWKCELNNNQWLCADEEYKEKNYALIVLSAKKAGADDSLESLEVYLKSPIEKVSSQFSSIESKVISINKKDIQGITWIDALHSESEIPGYYTRYLATVHEGLVVLVNLTIHQRYYRTFDNIFAPTVESLQLKSNGSEVNIEKDPLKSIFEMDLQSISKQTLDAIQGRKPINAVSLMGVSFLVVTILFGLLILKKFK